MRSPDLKIAFLVVVCVCALVAGVYGFVMSAGIDFYQFWGVSIANRLSNGRLSSPYVQVEQYGTLVDNYSRTSADDRLHVANAVNHEINPYGLDVNCTPLLYVISSLLPDDYSLAFGIFSFLRTLTLTGTLVILFYALRLRGYIALAIVIFALCFYEPLRADARVGNVNAFQLFALAVLTVVLARLRRERAEPGTAVTSTLFLCAVVLLTLIKPNFFTVSLALTASLYVIKGPRIFVRAVAGACVVSVVLWVIPCLYFGSWTVWTDWFGYLAIGSGKLSYGGWQGNFSLSQLVREVFHVRATYSIAAVVLLLGSSLGLVLFQGGPGARGLVRVLGDPYLCSAAAITVTLAASPLVWYHYFLLSLIPALWLSGSVNCKVCGYLSLLSLLLSSDVLPRLMDHPAFFPYFVALSWVPLWVGILRVIRLSGEEAASMG